MKRYLLGVRLMFSFLYLAQESAPMHIQNMSADARSIFLKDGFKADLETEGNPYPANDKFLDAKIASNEKLTKVLKREIVDYVSSAHLKTKLSVLYEFEKNYRQLISEYKEEIKFASSLQEDLRKERAKFFSETLKEVHQTLSESQVDNEVASKWIKELVGSYTKSLDLSGGLVEEHTLDTIACIRAEAKLNKPSIEPGNN